MAETAAEVRRDIEVTRERISESIAQLEQRLNIVDRIKENPLPAVGLALAAGLVLSQSGADRKAAEVTTSATRDTGSKLSEALDGVVATLVTSVTAAFHDRIDEAMKELATMIRGSATKAGGMTTPANSHPGSPRNEYYDSATSSPESGEASLRAD
jgi:predicted RecB family endonuclease